MSKSKTFSNILIFLLVVAGICLGYYYFVVGGGSTPSSAGITVTGPNGQPLDTANNTNDDFLQLLLSLKNVDLSASSSSFLSSDVLNKRLQDFSRPLPSEGQGRTNPFAPIGVGGSPVAPASTRTSASASSTASSSGTFNLSSGGSLF